MHKLAHLPPATEQPAVVFRRTRLPWLTPSALLLLVLVLLAVWCLRAQLSNGFTRVLGDVYDNTIEVAILEHWYNVFRGLAIWSRTNYFYPYQGTLGYNDGYFLYGVIYVIFRKLGGDPFLSSALVNLAMRLACATFFLLFAQRVLNIRLIVALFGSTIFALSDSLFIHSLHAQILTIAFAPLCGWLLMQAGLAFLENQCKSLLWYGTIFSLVYGAWALTAYYMLWFFTFFVSITLLILAMLQPVSLWRRMRALEKPTLLALLACAGMLIIALLPFLMLYLPKSQETGMHGIDVALAYVPGVFDIFNIGVSNYMYSGLVVKLHALIGFPIDFSEKQTGLTPLLLLCFFLSLLFMLGKLLRFRGSASRDGNVALSMAIAAMLTYALCLNVDGNTGWIYVYNFFPGAKAIRVVSRYYIFLGFPVACVGVYGLSLLRARAGSVLACAVCALLLAEQLNPDFNQAIERETAVQRLRMAQHVPAPCRAFFVTDARPLAIGQGDVDRVYRPNVEAMLLSEYVNLPTINGFSTFNPPDWHFDHAEHPEYAGLVRDFSERHHIDGLCALELTDMRWSEPPAVKSPDGGMASRP